MQESPFEFDELDDEPLTPAEAALYALGWAGLGVLALMFAREAFIASWGALHARTYLPTNP